MVGGDAAVRAARFWPAVARTSQLIEPTILAERHLLGEDDRIRMTDVPERMQVRAPALESGDGWRTLTQGARPVSSGTAALYGPPRQLTFADYMRPTKDMLKKEAEWMIKQPKIAAKALGQEVGRGPRVAPFFTGTGRSPSLHVPEARTPSPGLRRMACDGWPGGIRADHPPGAHPPARRLARGACDPTLP